jgi:hypothetical protein
MKSVAALRVFYVTEQVRATRFLLYEPQFLFIAIHCSTSVFHHLKQLVAAEPMLGRLQPRAVTGLSGNLFHPRAPREPVSSSCASRRLSPVEYSRASVAKDFLGLTQGGCW